MEGEDETPDESVVGEYGGVGVEVEVVESDQREIAQTS